MSWRSAKPAKQSAGDAFGEGFISTFVPRMEAERKAKLALETKMLDDARKKDAEESEWKAQSETLAKQIFPDNYGMKAAQDYVYNIVASYKGNVGQATERLEALTDDDRIAIAGPRLRPSSTLDFGEDGQMGELFSQFESGKGGYNALFSQQQDVEGSEFFGTKVSEMSLGELVTFTDPSGKYGQKNKELLKGTDTEAGRKGLTSTPLGQYQIIGGTLRDIMERGGDDLGLTEETIFNKETQDAMFLWYAKDQTDQETTPEGKRAALRRVWEGFRKKDKAGQFKVTDKQLDGVLSTVSEGKFTTGSVTTTPKLKKFNVGEKLAELTYDEDGLAKWELLKAEVNSERYDLTDTQLDMMKRVGEQIKSKIKEGGMFSASTFLTDNPMETAGKALANWNIVSSMNGNQFKGGEDERQRVLKRINNAKDQFNNQAIAKKQAEQAGKTNADLMKPENMLLFYARDPITGAFTEDGMLVRLTGEGTAVSLQDPTTPIQVGAENGLLTTQDLGAQGFVDTYNKPIRELAATMNNGSADLKNILDLRIAVQNNPMAFNQYLSFASSIGTNLEKGLDAVNMLLRRDRGDDRPLPSYEEVELKFFAQLPDMTNNPSREIFVRQLRASYGLARLEESKGQGLSDNELDQNLQTVGFGATTAKEALISINTSLDIFNTKMTARKNAVWGAIRGSEAYKDPLRQQGLDLDIIEFSSREGGWMNDQYQAQLDLAEANSTDVNTGNTPPPDEASGPQPYAVDGNTFVPTDEAWNRVVNSEDRADAESQFIARFGQANFDYYNNRGQE